eukprot:GEMP01000885.1.p1 GENE.GEMP01000885.1~~GEMP01000885.1.p1  ORF type:complete len:1370 (-),score=254.81 GEMP01000885.1:1802-5911(-)
MLVTVQDIDALWRKIDKVIEHIAGSQGAIKRQRFEADLLALYGDARDKIEVTLRMGREVLVDIFGGDCSRIAHLGVILEKQEFSTPGAINDQRTGMCRNMCSNVEGVLRDLGLSEGLKGARNAEERKWRQAGIAEKHKTRVAVTNAGDSIQHGNSIQHGHEQFGRTTARELTNSPKAHVNNGRYPSFSTETTNGQNRLPPTPQLQGSSKAGLQDAMSELGMQQRETPLSVQGRETPLPVRQRETSLPAEERDTPVPAQEPKTPPQVHKQGSPLPRPQQKLARERELQEMEQRENARQQRKLKRLESNVADVVQRAESKDEGVASETNSNPLDVPEHAWRMDNKMSVYDTLPPRPKPEDFGIKERPRNSSNWRASFPMMHPSEQFQHDSPQPLRRLDSPAKALLASPARSTLSPLNDRLAKMVPRRILIDKSPAMSKEAFKPRRILRKRTPSPKKSKIRQSMPPWTLSTRESSTPQMHESSGQQQNSHLTLHAQASRRQSSCPWSPSVVTSSIPAATPPPQHEVKNFVAQNVASVMKGLNGESRRESRQCCRETASCVVENRPRRRAQSLAPRKENLVRDRENGVEQSPCSHGYKPTKGVERDLRSPGSGRSEHEVKNFIALNIASVTNEFQGNSRREPRPCCRETASCTVESGHNQRVRSLAPRKENGVCERENGVERSPGSHGYKQEKGVGQDVCSLGPRHKDEDKKSSSTLVGILKKATDDNVDLPTPGNASSSTPSSIDHHVAGAEAPPAPAMFQKQLPEPLSPLSLTSDNDSTDSQFPIFDLTPKQFSSAGRAARERHDNRMLHTPITYSPKTFINGYKDTSTAVRSRGSLTNGLMASLIRASATSDDCGGKRLTSGENHGGGSSSSDMGDNSDDECMKGEYTNDSPMGGASAKKLSLSSFESEEEIDSNRSRSRSVGSENSKKTFCHDSDKDNPECDERKFDCSYADQRNKISGVPITPPPKALFSSDDDDTVQLAPLCDKKPSSSDKGCVGKKSVDGTIIDLSSPNDKLWINDSVPVSDLPQVSVEASSAAASLDTTVGSQTEKDSAIRTSASQTTTTTDARVVTVPQVRKSFFSGIFQKSQVIKGAKMLHPTAHREQEVSSSLSREKENIFSGISEAEANRKDNQLLNGGHSATRTSNDEDAASKDKRAVSCLLKGDHTISERTSSVMTLNESNGDPTRQQTPIASEKLDDLPKFPAKTTPYVPLRTRSAVSRSNSGSPRFRAINNSAVRSGRSSSSTAGVSAFPPRSTPFVPRRPRSVLSPSNSGSPRLHAFNSAVRDGRSCYRTMGVASDLPWVIERHVTDESLLAAFRLLEQSLGPEGLKAIDEDEAVEALRENGYPVGDAYHHVVALLYLNHLRLEEL